MFHAFVLLLTLLQTALWGDACQLDNGCGEPSDPLLQVLGAFGVCHDGSWPSIQQASEKAWLSHGRNVDLLELNPIVDPHPEKTYALFTELGMTQTVCACHPCYDYGVVLGANLATVRQRYWFLKTEWERGVRFSSVVMLTGDRPLDARTENAQTLLDPAYSSYPFKKGWSYQGPLPTNETEMMRLVWDQLDLPPEWNSLPVVFIDTPKPEGLKRPHTEHTLIYWLKGNPQPGTLLTISNQPFVCRQEAVLLPYLTSSFPMETVGEGFSLEHYRKEKRGLVILLAELAYRIKLYTKSPKSPAPLQAGSGSRSMSSLVLAFPFLRSAPCLYER